jgi:hypothetical protein
MMFLAGGLLGVAFFLVCVLVAVGIGHLASISLWLGLLGVLVAIFLLCGFATAFGD